MNSSTIDEKIVNLLNWMKSNTSYPGESIKSMLQKSELIAICGANNNQEIKFFIDHLKERNFVKVIPLIKTTLCALMDLIILMNIIKK